MNSLTIAHLTRDIEKVLRGVIDPRRINNLPHVSITGDTIIIRSLIDPGMSASEELESLASWIKGRIQTIGVTPMKHVASCMNIPDSSTMYMRVDIKLFMNEDNTPLRWKLDSTVGVEDVANALRNDRGHSGMDHGYLPPEQSPDEDERFDMIDQFPFPYIGNAKIVESEKIVDYKLVKETLENVKSQLREAWNEGLEVNEATIKHYEQLIEGLIELLNWTPMNLDSEE